jgi:hypothetical protein
MVSRVPAAHACNPSYSGGRDQENRSSKQAWADTSQDPILKKPVLQKKKKKRGKKIHGCPNSVANNPLGTERKKKDNF